MVNNLETIAEIEENVGTINFRRNAAHYLKRYGSAELIAALVSTVAAEIVYRKTGNEYVTGYATTVASYVSYFGTIISQEILERKKQRMLDIRDLVRIPQKIAKEFGVPSYLDFSIMRPYILEKSIKLLGGSVGGFLGNRIADIPFYSMCIFLDKLSRKKMKGGNE